MKLDANDPDRKSCVPVPEGSDFPLQNLPVGVFKTVTNLRPRIGIALGEMIIDLYMMTESRLLGNHFFDLEILNDIALNRFGCRI